MFHFNQKVSVKVFVQGSLPSKILETSFHFMFDGDGSLSAYTTNSSHTMSTGTSATV